MTLLRFRVTGDPEALQAVLAGLAGIEGVQRVEEVADLVPRMDDEDSSSAGLAENIGGHVGEIVVEVDGDDAADVVRRAAETSARSAGAALEAVDPE